MKEKGLMALLVLGYYVSLIGAVLLGGLKVGVPVVTACCCTAAAVQLMNREEAEKQERDHDSCMGCKNDLGGGMCKINLEAECGKGEHEAWEARR